MFLYFVALLALLITAVFRAVFTTTDFLSSRLAVVQFRIQQLKQVILFCITLTTCLLLIIFIWLVILILTILLRPRVLIPTIRLRVSLTLLQPWQVLTHLLLRRHSTPKRLLNPSSQLPILLL